MGERWWHRNRVPGDETPASARCAFCAPPAGAEAATAKPGYLFVCTTPPDRYLMLAVPGGGALRVPACPVHAALLEGVMVKGRPGG